MEHSTEALQAMTKADLASVIILYKLYPNVTTHASQKMAILQAELERRMDDVFVK